MVDEAKTFILRAGHQLECAAVMGASACDCGKEAALAEVARLRAALGQVRDFAQRDAEVDGHGWLADLAAEALAP